MSKVATTATLTRQRRPRKRGDGEGTLYFDAKAKLWRASLYIGMKTVKGSDGATVLRPDRRKVSARKQEDAIARLDALKGERRGGTLPENAARDTVAAFVERWLAAKAGVVRASTHKRYGELLRGHVVPTIGRTRLAELRPDALQRLYATKLKAGLSARTVHHVHVVTHNALRDAVRWGVVGRNVADVVEPPSVPTPDLRWPTAEEVSRLLLESARHNDRTHALWVLAAHSGARLGELLALRWDDVDLERGVVHVRRILTSVAAGVPTFGEPKTKRSRRTVPLSVDAIAALRAHRKRQAEERLKLGSEYGAYNLVFATELGTPLTGWRARAYYFKRALGWAKLPAKIRIHDLRHAAATMMLGSGVDVTSVATVLGHARNSTTLDTYGHSVPANVTSAVAALQRAIGGA